MTDPNAPLYSLVAGEGSGALLGEAAGDVAGGGHVSGYSSQTQQATVVAYHLLRNDGIDRDLLASEMAELGGTANEPAVYRGMSPGFAEWLEGARAGSPSATADPSAEPAIRAVAVGVWFRRDPEGLIEAAVSAARLTHIDAESVVTAAALAAAVAAACFGQSGSDLKLAAAEIAEKAAAVVRAEPYRYGNSDRLTGIRQRILTPAAAGSGPADALATALDLSGPVEGEPYRQIEEAARQGGSLLGGLVGAIIGARSGLRLWPWVIPNDIWFAEIGRRLVSRNQETRDLPVPYSVEERITSGLDRDL
jgi:ADP-ribosylglycohydrolase